MWSKIKHYMKWNFMIGHISIGNLTVYGRMPCIGECNYILKNTGIFVLGCLFYVMDIGGRCISIVVPMQHLGRQHL